MVFRFFSRVGLGFFLAMMSGAGVAVAETSDAEVSAGEQSSAVAEGELSETDVRTAGEPKGAEGEAPAAAGDASSEGEAPAAAGDASSEGEVPAAAEDAPSEAEESAASETDTKQGEEAKPRDRRAWRRDPTLRRRPGSYLGGGLGYTMVNAWYTVKLRDVVEDYDLGPMHGYLMFIRVGDAFYDWLAAGFQIDMVGATFAGTDAPGASSFALYVDLTFYPWRGLGLRPSVGVGFGFAQAGKEIYELGLGGPLTLSFTASYEFRVSRFFTMGPFVQVSWVKGEDFDALFFNVGLEMLKWFRTAEG